MKSKAKKTSFQLEGLIKHAQVARVLYLNQVTPAEFYIAARLCQEHLPPSTYESLRVETCRQKSQQKPEYQKGLLYTIRKLKAKGYLTTTPVPGKWLSETRVDITQQGWIFYLLLLAEMERPLREVAVFANRKKPKFTRVRNRKKAGAAIRRARFVALAKKAGLSIWERCALSSLPQYQRLENGAPKCTEADSSPPISAELARP